MSDLIHYYIILLNIPFICDKKILNISVCDINRKNIKKIICISLCYKDLYVYQKSNVDINIKLYNAECDI